MKKIFTPTLLASFLLFASCGEKNNSTFHQNTAPAITSLNLSNVFTDKDRQLDQQDSITNFLKNYYQRIWENDDLSGGILIAKGDRVLFENYRGFANENKDEITGQTPLHVASVSKTLTMSLILKLADQGKLSLQQKLCDIFPGFPYPKITVEMLLKQRSGLPKYEIFFEKAHMDAKKMLSNQDVLDFLIKNKPELARNPNTGFMYCNTNFALLALLAEKKTGIAFPVLMEQMVFEPLQMKNSYVLQQKDLPKASQSFYNNHKVFETTNLDLIYGDKNVYTTPRDLLRFSTALYSKEFLSAKFKDLIFEPYSNEKQGMNNYGMGFRMKIFDNGKKLTYHNGWWHGSNAVFAHLLDSKVTIIAIGNKYSNKVYSALALSGLFEDFPLEKEHLHDIVYKGKLPSTQHSSSGLGSE